MFGLYIVRATATLFCLYVQLVIYRIANQYIWTFTNFASMFVLLDILGIRYYTNTFVYFVHCILYCVLYARFQIYWLNNHAILAICSKQSKKDITVLVFLLLCRYTSLFYMNQQHRNISMKIIQKWLAKRIRW